MGLIATKYDIGDHVVIITPEIDAQVIAIVYNGFTTLYRCVYWINHMASFYEAYDYEISDTELEENVEYEGGNA